MNRPELVICDDPMPHDLLPASESYKRIIGYDLLRAPSEETILMAALDSAKFLQQNPTWAIVGVNLTHNTVKTPFGDIGAIIE